MKKLLYGTKINGTDESGLVDVNTKPPTIFCVCTKKVADEILKNMSKAKSYEELENKIAAFYPEDESEETGDLCDLGEVAAMHFGFM